MTCYLTVFDYFHLSSICRKEWQISIQDISVWPKCVYAERLAHGHRTEALISTGQCHADGNDDAIPGGNSQDCPKKVNIELSYDNFKS